MESSEPKTPTDRAAWHSSVAVRLGESAGSSISIESYLNQLTVLKSVTDEIGKVPW